MGPLAVHHRLSATSPCAASKETQPRQILILLSYCVFWTAFKNEVILL